MYQYWERNEAEDAWPLKAAADQLKLCVGFIGWRWCTCGADEGFKSKAFAFNKGWKWKLTACWWLYVWRHLVLCMNAECRDLFLTPRGIKRSFNANKISALEIVLQKKKPKKTCFFESICSVFPIGSYTASQAAHNITSRLFQCFQSLFAKSNHRICIEFKYVSALEKRPLTKRPHIYSQWFWSQKALKICSVKRNYFANEAVFEMFWVTCGWVGIFQHPKQCEIWRKEAHWNHKRLNITTS